MLGITYNRMEETVLAFFEDFLLVGLKSTDKASQSGGNSVRQASMSTSVVAESATPSSTINCNDESKSPAITDGSMYAQGK